MVPSDNRSTGNASSREVGIVEVNPGYVDVHGYREALGLGLLQANHGDTLLLDNVPYYTAPRAAVEATCVSD
jgi:hypothetical protein